MRPLIASLLLLGLASSGWAEPVDEIEDEEEAEESADELKLLVPLQDLLGRLTPPERRKFFSKYPYLKARVRLEDKKGGGYVLTPEEEAEKLRTDPDFRKKKEAEQAELESHIRPAEDADAAPAPAPAAEPPAPTASAPSPAAIETVRPAVEPQMTDAERRRVRMKSKEDAEKAIREMQEREIDLGSDD